MKHECTINYNRYIPFKDGDINYFYNKMNGYVLYKEYDSSFCDLMTHIMANALKEQIVILESTNCFHTLNAIPQVESVSKLTKITSLSHLYHVIDLYKEGYHYDACVRMSSREVKSQSSASFYSHPVSRKYYSMNKLGVSSIDDFDMQSDIFHGNKTMNRLSNTSNTYCFYDSLETNVAVGNESDDKHDASDITDEYAVDYLQYAQKYRLDNPRNCIIGHPNINSIRNKFGAVECVLNEGLLNIFAIQSLNQTIHSPYLSLVWLTFLFIERTEIDTGVA